MLEGKKEAVCLFVLLSEAFQKQKLGNGIHAAGQTRSVPVNRTTDTDAEPRSSALFYLLRTLAGIIPAKP